MGTPSISACPRLFPRPRQVPLVTIRRASSPSQKTVPLQLAQLGPGSSSEPLAPCHRKQPAPRQRCFAVAGKRCPRRGERKQTADLAIFAKRLFNSLG